MGLHLLERFYLVSDTRVTRETESGLVVFEDNLIKTFHFNKRIDALAAGQALPASYILNRLKEKVSEDSTISDLKAVINAELKSLISDYVNTTSYHSGRVALIFAGFDDQKNKKIEASILGNTMSAMVRAAGEGIQVNQSVDSRLTKALANIGGKGKGDYIEVKDVFQSKMFTVTLNVRTAEWELGDVECYQYAIFYPDQSIKTVQVPPELLSALEFRNRSKTSLNDQLYEEAEILINFVKRTTSQYEFWTVGGHIFVLLLTPSGNKFPTGDFGKVKEGQIVKAGSFFVRDGKLMYQFEDGKVGQYRHLESISKKFLKDRDKTYLADLIL